MSFLRLVVAVFTLSTVHGLVPDIENLNMTEIEATMKAVLLILRNQHNGASGGGIPGVEILDPMPIPDFSSPVEQTLVDVTVDFQQMTISGLSNYSIDRVSANLGKLEVSIGLNVTNITIVGKYRLDGTVTWRTVSSAGPFQMNITNTYVWGTIRMRVSEEGHLEVHGVDLDCTVQKLDLHFEKLFGGRFFASLANTILNAISPMIFDNAKPTILEQMSTTVKDSINVQLETIPDHALLQWSGSPLDMIIANTAAEIRNQGLDPIELPPQSGKFQRNLFLFTIYGEASLHNGYLNGLSTLHRTEDIIMSFQNNTFEISANLGFQVLEGGYKWQASTMGISRKGGLHFRVKKINLQLILTQFNEVGHRPQIKSFDIKKLGQIGIDVDGLGSLDFVMEFIINFVTNVFKKQLAYVVQHKIKNIMEEQVVVNNVQMPF